MPNVSKVSQCAGSRGRSVMWLHFTTRNATRLHATCTAWTLGKHLPCVKSDSLGSSSFHGAHEINLGDPSAPRELTARCSHAATQALHTVWGTSSRSRILHDIGKLKLRRSVFTICGHTRAKTSG